MVAEKIYFPLLNYYAVIYLLTVKCITILSRLLLRNIISLVTVSCPSGWSNNPSNTKCFKYSANNESWDASEKKCKSDDGHLAAVTSLQELIVLQKLCSEDSKGCWVGGKLINGDWKWSDNSSCWNASTVPSSLIQSGCTNQSCFSSNLTDWCTLMINGTASLVAQGCNMSHAFLCMLDMGMCFPYKLVRNHLLFGLHFMKSNCC